MSAWTTAAPVVSGSHESENGNTFYVCRSSAENNDNKGGRAGYNVKPLWANACWVGLGGLEVAVTPYDCMCN